MHVEMEAVAPDVAPDDALAWWSDFRDGPHDHAFLRGETRRVVTREAGTDAVTMVDRFHPLGIPLFTERTKARPEPGAIVFEGVNDYARFSGRYAFEAVENGTRVRLVAEVELKRPLRPAEPLARPLVLAILRTDLRHHVRDMQRDLRDRREA